MVGAVGRIGCLCEGSSRTEEYGTIRGAGGRRPVTQLDGDRLEEWINIVEKDSSTAIASLARNLRRAIDAVRNGLTLPYGSGTVEGHVNRVKCSAAPTSTYSANSCSCERIEACATDRPEVRG